MTRLTCWYAFMLNSRHFHAFLYSGHFGDLNRSKTGHELALVGCYELSDEPDLENARTV